MKAAIRLFVRFVLWFAAIVLAASALVVAHAYVTGFDPAGASSISLLPALLYAFALVWIPAVLVAGLIALFSALRSLDAPAAGLGILAAAWTLTLSAGVLVVGPAVAPPSPAAIVPEGSLIRAGSVRLLALERAGTVIDPMVIHDDDARLEFSTVDRAVAEYDPAVRATVVRIPLGDRPPIPLTNLENAYPAMVSPPSLLEGLMSDARRIADLLAFGGWARREVLLNILGLGLFLLGSWTLVRLTRWPLFNALFAVAAVRFALWIMPAVEDGVLRGVLISAFDSTVIPIASAVILGGLGVGLLALLVFMPNTRDWRQA